MADQVEPGVKPQQHEDGSYPTKAGRNCNDMHDGTKQSLHCACKTSYDSVRTEKPEHVEILYTVRPGNNTRSPDSVRQSPRWATATSAKVILRLGRV